MKDTAARRCLAAPRCPHRWQCWGGYSRAEPVVDPPQPGRETCGYWLPIRKAGGPEQ